MFRLWLRTLAACVLVLVVACASTPPTNADIYYGLTLLDPATETRTENAYVVIADGRVLTTGVGEPPASPPERRHDMTGLYALPGLIDTHAHVTLGPVEVRVENGAPALVARSDDAIAAFNARMLVAFGVTTIRNPGGSAERNAAYAARVASGELLGPTALAAGELLDHMPFEGLSVVVSDGASIEAAVARQAAAGMQYIKLYHLLDENQIAAGVAAAHRHGMRAIIHTGDVSWTRAAELGVDGIVHAMPISPDLLPADRRDGYRGGDVAGARAFYDWWERADLDAPEIRAMIDALVEHDVTVDLTLVVFQKAFWGDDASVREVGIEFTHPAMRENWRVFRFDTGWTADDYARARAVWPKIQRFTRMLHEAGVLLTMGTDFANPFVSPADVHTEMRLLQEAGIPSWAVLRMATSDAARSMGLGESIGRIARGYEADFIFTAADPSLDVANLGTLRTIVIDGRRYQAAALRQP